MSRDKGNRAAAWLAAYLTRWGPHAEATPNGRSGPDIETTPGVAFEVKTGKQFRTAWIDQAVKYGGQGALPVLVWLGEGQGQASVPRALALVPGPLDKIMTLLAEAGYAAPPAPPREPAATGRITDDTR